MRPTEFWMRTLTVLVLAGVLALYPGCASTKNVMNKATFGLVGGSDEASADASDEQKRAAKEERKQQEAAEKQAKKDAKAAKKEQERQEKEASGERGFMSKATFGLVGSSEEKAAKKEAKRQAKEEKKARERAEEEQKEAEEQARKDEKAAQKGEERSLMSKATFGLVGGDSEEKAAKKEAKRQAKEEKKAQERAEEEQEKADKQARKQAKAEQKQAEDVAEPAEAEEPKAERSLMSKATFGLVGGDSEEKAAKKEAKRQAKDEEKAQERAEEEQEEAEKQARKEQKAAQEAEQPEEKRGLMSKLTFGLVGGKGEDAPEEGTGAAVEQEMPASTPEPPVAMPGADAQFDVQPATALSGDAQKLARLPFETVVTYDSTSASGKPQAVASRSTYSKHGFGITDLGDVRIAVRDMEFDGGTKGGAIVISSEDRAKASGRAGIGNESFNFDYAKGVTSCTFGTIQFTVQQGVLTIGGRTVPMGKGHKLVVLDGQGNVEGVYAIQ